MPVWTAETLCRRLWDGDDYDRLPRQPIRRQLTAGDGRGQLDELSYSRETAQREAQRCQVLWRSRARWFLARGLVVLAAALLALASLVAAIASSESQMLQAEGKPQAVAEFQVVVSRAGFNGKAGDLLIEVEQGQAVRIIFSYGDLDLDGNNSHRIVIEEYGVDVWLDREQTEVIVNFVADMAGSFAIRCKIPCVGHKNLQAGLLRVKPGMASTLPTSLLLSGPPLISGAGPVTLTATVRDWAGEPLAGTPVRFYWDADFLGVSSPMELGSAESDSEGVASFQFEPRVTGTLTLLAKFEGVGNYEPSVATINLEVEDAAPAFVPSGRSGLDIPAWGPWWIFLLVGAVCTTYAFVLYQVYRLRQVR